VSTPLQKGHPICFLLVSNARITYDQDTAVPSANEAKKQGITMLSIIGVTLRGDMQERIDIASEMPTSNATMVQDAKTKAVFESNEFVTYVSTIQGLDGIVSQLAFSLSKAVCVYEIH